MTKQTINPPELFNSIQFGFSQIAVKTGGKHVYLSGQVAWDSEQNIVGAGDLAAQVEQTLRNIETAMQAAGGTLNDIVSMRIYILDDVMEDSHHVSAGLKSWFSAENAPATTWIGVRSLARPEFLIEIEAVAIINL